MQRIFSTFPNGWPGCGLLLLRVTCAAPPLAIGTAELSGWPDAVPGMQLFSCLTALLILAGLWTPLAASCHAILQGLLAFAGESFALAHLILAMIGVSLVMLGPGSWSIDARLYGRKRIDLGQP
jgi:putative oxidoreductase